MYIALVFISFLSLTAFIASAISSFVIPTSFAHFEEASISLLNSEMLGVSAELESVPSLSDIYVDIVFFS